MTLKWNDPAFKGGTMKRTALWLIDEIGIGNSFTKEQLRAAFPGVSQADRRLRDLRNHGWVIHTSSQDVSLNSEEQRLITVGKPVWERGLRQQGEVSVTAKQRRAALAESDYQCSSCGVAGGEIYPDAPNKTAVLGVAKRSVTFQDGKSKQVLVVECQLCRSGLKTEDFNIPALVGEFSALPELEKAIMLTWIDRDRRSRLDRIWKTYRRLPKEIQKEVKTSMADEN